MGSNPYLGYSEYDHLGTNLKSAIGGIGEEGLKRPIIIDGSSRDPLAAAPAYIIPPGTPLGQVARTGMWKPVRRTLNSAAETASGWNLVLNCDSVLCFAVGDVVQTVDVATNVVVDDLGAITAIDTGAKTITVTNGIGGNLSDGEVYVEVTESAGATKETLVILRAPVSLLAQDGSTVDKGAEGIWGCHQPVYTRFINAVNGVDDRLRAAANEFLLIDN